MKVLSNFINTAAAVNALFQWAKLKLNAEAKPNVSQFRKADYPTGFGLEKLKFVEEISDPRSIQLTLMATQIHQSESSIS